VEFGTIPGYPGGKPAPPTLNDSWVSQHLLNWNYWSRRLSWLTAIVYEREMKNGKRTSFEHSAPSIPRVHKVCWAAKCIV
jgi:hypothetical protein